MKKRNCKAENIQCGGTCLNPTVKDCTLNLSDSVSNQLTQVASRVSDQPEWPDFSELEPDVLGSYAKIYFLGGSVYKVPTTNLLNPEAEVELQKMIPGAPEVIRYNPKTQVVEMEFVKGRVMKDVIENQKPKEVKRLLTKSLMALSAIHQAGYTHNDWHYKNHIVDDDGSIRPIDFGLSKSIRENGKIKWSKALIEMKNTFGNDYDLETHFDLYKSKVKWKNLPDGDKFWRTISAASTESEAALIYKAYVNQLRRSLM